MARVFQRIDQQPGRQIDFTAADIALEGLRKESVARRAVNARRVLGEAA